MKIIPPIATLAQIVAENPTLEECTKLKFVGHTILGVDHYAHKEKNYANESSKPLRILL